MLEQLEKVNGELEAIYREAARRLIAAGEPGMQHLGIDALREPGVIPNLALDFFAEVSGAFAQPSPYADWLRRAQGYAE